MKPANDNVVYTSGGGRDLSHIALMISLLTFAALVVFYFNSKAGVDHAAGEATRAKAVPSTSAAYEKRLDEELRSILVRLANVEGLDRRISVLEGARGEAKALYQEAELTAMVEGLKSMKFQLDDQGKARLTQAVKLLDEVREDIRR